MRMPDKNIVLTVIVNGTPTEVGADPNQPLGSIVPVALQQTGNSGQPPGNWELKDGLGNLLDLNKKIGDYNFPANTKLFLSLKAGVGGV
jgi:hypothetical protein